MKPMYQSVSADRNCFLENTQVALQVKIATKDLQVERVLGVRCTADVTSYECLEGSVVFLGKAHYKLLVWCDGRMESLNYHADFSDKIEHPSLTPQSKPEFRVQPVDVRIRSVSDGEIVVDSVLSVDLYQTERTSANVLTDCEEVRCKHASQRTYTQRKIEGQFETEYRAALHKDVSKVLFAESGVDITSVSTQTDSVLLAGSTYTYLAFLTPEGEIETEIFEVPYTEEVSAAGATTESVANVFARTDGTKVQLDLGENTSTLSFQVKVVVSGRVTLTCPVDSVEDAYSLTHGISLETQTLESTRNVTFLSVAGKAEGNVEVEEALMGQRPSSFLNPCVTVVEAKPFENSVVTEGVLTGYVVYGGEQPQSVPAEIPFRIVSEVQDVTPTCRVEATGTVTDVVCRKGVNGAEIVAVMKLQLNVSCPEQTVVATDCISGEEKIPSGAAIEVFFGRKGQTLWEVCKTLNATEEEILECNPSLQLPLQGGERILIYRKA